MKGKIRLGLPLLSLFLLLFLLLIIFLLLLLPLFLFLLLLIPVSGCPDPNNPLWAPTVPLDPPLDPLYEEG